MNESSISEADLQAWVDGRLPEPRRAGVEAYLAVRPQEAVRLEAYRVLNERLRALYAPVLDEPVPPRLRIHPSRRRRRFALAAALVALGAAAGFIAGWELHELRSGAEARQAGVASFVRSAVLAHATYSPEVRHPVEVGADQESHLVAWLSKRLGAKVRAPHLQALGYSLVGGRLLPGESGPAAQFMYQCQTGTRVTLYLRTERKEQKETALRYERDGNVGVFYWIDRGFGYALASADIDRELLSKVANAAYAQLDP